MNRQEFFGQINQFDKQFKDRDLETYLLALYQLIEAHKNKEVTYELILELLKKAFAAEPIEFDNQWLSINYPPDRNRLNLKFTNPDFKNVVDKTNTSDLSPYDFTMEVLKFQIADLHKMKGKQLADEMRYFGVTSETGNSWYNFNPLSNLSCGVACVEDNEIEWETADWSIIGEILEYGRIYE